MTHPGSSQSSPFRPVHPNHISSICFEMAGHILLKNSWTRRRNSAGQQLFIVIDSLNRSGIVELRRKSFTYWLRKAEPWGAANVSHPHC